MRTALLLILAFCAVNCYAQSTFTQCSNYKGAFSFSSYSFSGVTPSDFLTITLNGTINGVSLTGGSIQIRLTNSDTSTLATNVQGISLCDAGENGHNICNLPPNTPVIMSAQVYWSPYYPKGSYDMSVIAYGTVDNSGTQKPVTCGDLTFVF